MLPPSTSSTQGGRPWINEIRRLSIVEDPSQGDLYEIVVARLEEEWRQAKALLSKVIDSIKCS